MNIFDKEHHPKTLAIMLGGFALLVVSVLLVPLPAHSKEVDFTNGGHPHVNFDPVPQAQYDEEKRLDEAELDYGYDKAAEHDAYSNGNQHDGNYWRNQSKEDSQ